MRFDNVKDFENDVSNSRVKKNENLYKEISKSEIDNFNITSNESVLLENEKNLDVEKIKKILDTKYSEIPKRKSIRVDITSDEDIPVEDTKEYDINVILEKAKEQKYDNYEEEKFKKINDTGYDILNNLNIEDTNKEEKDLDLENVDNIVDENEFDEETTDENNQTFYTDSNMIVNDDLEDTDEFVKDIESGHPILKIIIIIIIIAILFGVGFLIKTLYFK